MKAIRVKERGKKKEKVKKEEKKWKTEEKKKEKWEKTKAAKSIQNWDREIEMIQRFTKNPTRTMMNKESRYSTWMGIFGTVGKYTSKLFAFDFSHCWFCLLKDFENANQFYRNHSRVWSVHTKILMKIYLSK